jgi:hypothetical protein
MATYETSMTLPRAKRVYGTGGFDNGYLRVRVDKKKDYFHRVKAEKALGRPLPPGVEVHHFLGNKDVDAQLVICPGRWYHKLLHKRELARFGSWR